MFWSIATSAAGAATNLTQLVDRLPYNIMIYNYCYVVILCLFVLSCSLIIFFYCHVMICCVMICCVMLCCVMICYVMLCSFVWIDESECMCDTNSFVHFLIFYGTCTESNRI